MEGERERIAVISLQRLGDLLTAARITDALAQRKTTASVELVHWDSTAQAAALLPGVSARHTLPFGALRRRSRIHPLAALRHLSERTAAIIGARGFDRVVNLSSTRFACWFAPTLLVPHGTIVGPAIDGNGRYYASHRAIDYLNDWGTDPQLCTFAHADLYALAAGVRLAGFAGLRDRAGRRDGPVVLHVFGSERAKDWRTPDDWIALIHAIGRDLGRPCVLVGAPDEADALSDIAAHSGSRVVTSPLEPYLKLLTDATGLISVDTVAIHLAQLVGTPTVVLRQGSARGHAFIPGAHAICLDAVPDPARVADIIAVARRQFFGGHGPSDAPVQLQPGVIARAGVCDKDGLLGLATPEWISAGPQVRAAQRRDASWRAIWRDWFAGRTPPSDAVAAALAGSSEQDAARRQRVIAGVLGPDAAAIARHIGSAA